jgi:nucleotide-binding universal stress UspA family protein
MNDFPARILLTTDGSEGAALAARAAVELANRSGSELHVMHAFEFIPPREYMSVALRLHSPRSFPRQGQRLLDEQVGRVEEALEKAEAQLQSRADDLERWLGSRPEVKLVGDESAEGIGSIARTILGEAREADAATPISVGSRGLGRISWVRIESVSTQVVRAAEAPVLVYPHPRDA